MNALVIKLAPTALMLGVGGYLVRPYLGATAAPAVKAAAAANTSEIPDSLLQPTLAPSPLRHPFQDPIQDQARIRAEIRQRIGDLTKRIEAARKETKRTAATGRGGRSGGTNVLSGLVLKATYTRDGKGAALINGRVFQTGENVRPEDHDEPCVLTEVRLQSVVLRHRGEDLVLKYTLAAPGARAGAPGARVAAPAAKRARTSKNQQAPRH